MTPADGTFEDRLLDALLDRLDAWPIDAGSARRGIRHRPRARRCAGVVGALAAAAAVSLIVAEVAGSASPASTAPSSHAYALAAWTSRPTAAAHGQVAAAEGGCSISLGGTGASGKQGPLVAGGPWDPALVDTRGDLTLVIYSDGTEMVTCLTGPTFVWLSGAGAVSVASLPAASARVDRVRAVAAGGYTFAVGQVGAAVTGVAVQRVDGSVVAATVGGGFFIAWWPHADGVRALSVTAGSTSRTIPVSQRAGLRGPQQPNEAVHH